MIGPHLRRGQDVDYSLYQSVQQFGYLLAPSVDVGPIGTVAVYERQPKNQGNNGAATISGSNSQWDCLISEWADNVANCRNTRFRGRKTPSFAALFGSNIAKSLILRHI